MKAAADLGARDDQFTYIPNGLLRGQVEQFLGDPLKARRYYDAAREDLERRVAARPDDERYHSALGIAYAGLGRKEEALKEAQRGADLLPVEREAWRGTHRLRALAQVSMMVGEEDRALDLLQRLLTIPSEISKELLRVDPTWRALHGSKRFQALLKGEPS
jgi:serine/threonine-protein kinase